MCVEWIPMKQQRQQMKHSHTCTRTESVSMEISLQNFFNESNGGGFLWKER